MMTALQRLSASMKLASGCKPLHIYQPLQQTKTNKQRLAQYPNLWGYTCELYQIPGVAETVNMDHIKYHYFASHLSINPTGIVPKGPDIDYMQPHGRG